VRAVHTHVRGTDAVTGLVYRAEDPELLLWVHAGMVDSIAHVVQRYGRALDAADADRYVAELSKANVAADVGRRIRVHQKTTEFFGHKVLCFHFLDLGLRHRLARTRIWTKVRQTSVGKRIRRIADRVW